MINQDIKSKETRVQKLVSTEVQTDPLHTSPSPLGELFRALPYSELIYWYFSNY